MLETQGYNIKFVQKASPTERDAFDFVLVYNFFSTPSGGTQKLKYIVRAEAHEDVFAIKFYAARDRKLDNKYNRIINTHGYKGAIKIFMTCASIIPLLMKDYPNSSFVINGARSIDLEKDKIEEEQNNQRFRIYRSIATRLIGEQIFAHFQFSEISSYLLVKRDGQDVEKKKDSIKNMFLSRYEMEEL